MLNENTGCVQALPSDAQTIGHWLVDDRHVYWKSEKALGGSPGQPEAAPLLLRVDLYSGRFEHVAMPAMDISSLYGMLAHDDATIYVRQSRGGILYAVRKPQ